MKKEIMIDAISSIDTDLIEKYFETEEALKGEKKKRKPTWLRWQSLVAAGVCLVVLTASLAAYWLNPNGDIPPTYDSAYFSAEDAANAFMTTDGATSSYTKVYLSEDTIPKLAPLPTEEYANVYNIRSLIKPFYEEEFNSFIDGILPELTSALDMYVNDFEKYGSGDYVYYRTEQMRLTFLQQDGKNDYGKAFAVNKVLIGEEGQPIYFNGKLLSVDKRQSEEEIIESLAGVREILFDALDCSFDSAEVVFKYDGNYEKSVKSIYVYYYNKADYIIRGDHICLYFDNYANSSAETESADIMTQCSIEYYSYLTPISEAFSVEAKCKLISLEDAEVLLKNGYVFGGHSCSLCMAEQEKVSFDEYDYVGFEYVANCYAKSARAMPFYTFYKKIGKTNDGKIIYAKTYVCAIEVSGLEEYFQKQESQHNK